MFSVITVNYNNCYGLKKTIESVISQKHPSFEFIVIDGDSKDKSIQLLKNFKNQINNIVSESDLGVYDAMNKGWRLAKGEYCIFMNSGDIFANSEVLNEVHSQIEVSSDIIYGCHLWGSKDGERWNPKKDFKFREIMCFTPISHQATFIKKTILEKVGGFKTEYKIIADWGVLLDSMRMNARLQKISLDICIAEEPGESNVSIKQISDERSKYLKRHHLFIFLFNKYVVLPSINIINKYK